MVHSDVLGRALQKVRSLLQGDEIQFEPAELQELHAFVMPQLQNPNLAEKDRNSHEQVYAVVRDHWELAGLGPLPDLYKERHQHGFRASLDKFLQERYDEVSADDLTMLRTAYHRMAGLPQRKDSHNRLMRMMADGLARYKAYLATTAMAPAPPTIEFPVDALEPENPASGAAPTERSASELFAEAPRVELNAIGVFPTLLRVRQVEVTGDHVVDGEIPENTMLRVHGGSVHVLGMCHGHVHASGSIKVEGAVSGGWLYAEEGALTVKRAMAGARLIALRGDIALESAEGADLLLSRGTITVSGNLHGGQAIARALGVAGELAGTGVCCAGMVRAAQVGSFQRTNARVILARFIDLSNFGAETEDGNTASQLRELHKATLVANGCHTVVKAIREDMRQRMRAVLFQTRVARRSDLTLAQLRLTQKTITFLSAVHRLGSDYYSGTLEALELPETEMRRSVGNLVDITTRHLQRIDQEMIQHIACQTPEARNTITQASRHVTSAMKKCRDSLRKEISALLPLEALAGRLAEFDRTITKARQNLDGLRNMFGREMGAFQGENAAALRDEVETALRDAEERNAIDRETRTLADSLDRLEQRAQAAETELRQAEAALDEVRRALAEQGTVIFPETWPPPGRVEAGEFTPGVIIGVSPLRDPDSGLPLGTYIQARGGPTGPTVYVRHGHTCIALNENPAQTA